MSKIIGTFKDPVDRAYIREIYLVENISNSTPDVIVFPETQTQNGMQFNTTTNEITIKEISTYTKNVALGANYINGNGINAGVNFPGGGVNLKQTGNFLVTGVVTTQGKISVGGNIQLNGNWVSNDGNNEGIRIDDGGIVTVSDGFKSLSFIEADGGAIFQLSVRTNGVFNVAGTDGLNTTIDFSTYVGTVTVAGGLIIAK